MNRLPLVAAQPGIWMAEQLTSLPNAWSVAHYTELKGNIDAPLLAKAIVEGMRQADTLRMRFVQENGEVWQWVDDAMSLPEPSVVRAESHDAAMALMAADFRRLPARSPPFIAHGKTASPRPRRRLPLSPRW